MKALITLIAMTLLTTSAFADSMYGSNVESAEGKAVVLNHVGDNFADVEIKGEAAKLLYFAIKIAPTTSHNHITQLPIETKEIRTTVCNREMQEDSSVTYECRLFTDLQKPQN